MEKRQSFLQGTIILVLANVFVKIIGAMFKIPLTNLIGASGMGDFSIAFNIYAVMFVVSTAGLPVAISKMVAEANAQGRFGDVSRIVKCAFFVFFTISICLMSVVIFFADDICRLIGSETAHLSIVAIAPCIGLVTIIAIFRGYYQGHHNMSKTAISQMIEAVFKLFIGYFFAKYLIDLAFDTSVASAGAIFGVTVATAISCAYLSVNILFFRKKSRLKPTTSCKNITKGLFQIAVPITLGASILSLTSIVDMFTILRRLQEIGVSNADSNALYGAYNMAITIYNLPQAIVMAISISVIPLISECYKNKPRVNEIFNSALGMSVMVAMPCATGFVVMSTQILNFLYYKRPDDVLMASPILVILGIAVVFVSIVIITNATLQAISKPLIPVRSMCIGIVVKIIANYILVGIPTINISGAPMGTVLCFLVIAVLNLHEIRKNLAINLKINNLFIKPIISSFLMSLVISKSYQIFDKYTNIGTILVIFVAGISYFVIMYFLGVFRKNDFNLIKINKK